MNKKIFAVLGIILGILLIVVAVIYFTTPAKNLPSFFPGYDVELSKIHFKHAIGSLLLGLGAFIFSWFQTGKNHLTKNKSEVNPPNIKQ